MGFSNWFEFQVRVGDDFDFSWEQTVQSPTNARGNAEPLRTLTQWGQGII